MQVGIVGLPLSGKTTLFNALTRGSAEIDGFERTRQDSHIAVVKVPDGRLDALSRIFQPKKTTPTTVQYVDVGGLEKGISQKGGFSDQFLGKLRTVDALLLVLRLFKNELIPHFENSLNPVRDFESINTEFMISDLNIVEHRLARLEKSVPTTKDANEKLELELMRQFLRALEDEQPLRELNLSPHDEALIRGYQFLTIKPLLIVLNIGEEHLKDQGQIMQEYARLASRSKCALTTVCAEMEMEIEQLEEKEALLFFREMGIDEPALSKIVRESYDLLNLISFFTFVSDEVRAWTIPRGTTAKAAAGAIHSDIERGFIRAEVVHFDNLQKAGSIRRCREEGMIRLEGKEYIVQDGDVITFRFNV